MGVKEIEDYKKTRLLNSGGSWVNDAWLCIMYCLENRVALSDVNDAEEYEHIVEIAEEYLSDHPDMAKADELRKTILDDTKRHCKILTREMILITGMHRRYLDDNPPPKTTKTASQSASQNNSNKDPYYLLR